jgi:hypothetical protein
MKLIATHEDKDLFDDEFIKAYLSYQNFEYQLLPLGFLPFAINFVVTLGYLLFGIAAVRKADGAARASIFVSWWLGILITLIPLWYFRVKEYIYHKEHS